MSLPPRLLLALLPLLAAGCKSAAQHQRDADREAYALVASRRARIVEEPASFTIEPDPGSLRQRILRGEASGPQAFTLEQILEVAAENSREYQRNKEALYLAALDVTLERWRFDLQSSGTSSAEVSGTGDEAAVATGDARVGISKLFAAGGKFLANVGLSLTRTLLSSDGWHPTSDLQLAFTQPLLAGSSPLVVEEALTQSERDLVYEARSFERFRRTFAFDVVTRYYRVLQTADAVANQENDVANLTALRQRNEALVEAGRLADIELGQAKQNELRSKNDLIDQRARLEQQLDDFKLVLGLPTETQIVLDGQELAKLVGVEHDPLAFTEDAAIEAALAARLDHATVAERRVDADRKVRVAEDALRATLGLRADASLVSADGKPLRFDANDATWRVGLDYVAPWEKLPQRNAWRAAQIAAQSAARALEQSTDQIRADLRGDMRTFESQRQSYVIQLNAVELAKRRIESTRLKLDAGRADTRDLLEAQASLLEAQNAATTALVAYTLSRLRLFLDMERLRVGPDGIELEDFPARNEEARP